MHFHKIYQNVYCLSLIEDTKMTLNCIYKQTEKSRDSVFLPIKSI